MFESMITLEEQKSLNKLAELGIFNDDALYRCHCCNRPYYGDEMYVYDDGQLYCTKCVAIKIKEKKK